MRHPDASWELINTLMSMFSAPTKEYSPEFRQRYLECIGVSKEQHDENEPLTYN